MPNFPTDSLYKFMALGGIALMISCSVLMHLRVSAVHSRANEYFLQSVIQKADNDLLLVYSTSTSITDLRNAYINNFRLSELSDQVIPKSIYYKFETIIIFVLFFVGSLLSYCGFSLWYVKLQKYIDIQIERESKK